MYDPVANRWTSTTLPRGLAGEAPEAAVWTGHVVVVAAVNVRHGRLSVASYNPASRRWRVITPRLHARHQAQWAAMVATSRRLILWRGWDRVRKTRGGYTIASGVDVLARSRRGWRDVTGRWPQHQTVVSPVFTGRHVLVSPGQIWCGSGCPGPYAPQPGYFASPVTLRRSIIPGGPLGQADPAFVWAGHQIIAVDIDADIVFRHGAIRPGDFARYLPASGRWLRLPTPPHRPAIDTAPVWTGTELLTLTAHGQLLALRA